MVYNLYVKCPDCGLDDSYTISEEQLENELESNDSIEDVNAALVTGGVTVVDPVTVLTVVASVATLADLIYKHGYSNSNDTARCDNCGHKLSEEDGEVEEN